MGAAAVMSRKVWLAAILAVPAAVWAVEGIEAKIRFTDVAAKAGLQTMHHTRHFNGESAQ